MISFFPFLIVVLVLLITFLSSDGYSTRIIVRKTPSISSFKALRTNKDPNGSAPKVESDDEKKKNKFSISGLVQLVMMGAGAPMLGEYKETDESGRMLFELEANNFADSEGNSLQTKAPYFEKGYEGDRFDEKPPGFWANLLSGGKLQAEWDEKMAGRG